MPLDAWYPQLLVLMVIFPPASHILFVACYSHLMAISRFIHWSSHHIPEHSAFCTPGVGSMASIFASQEKVQKAAMHHRQQGCGTWFCHNGHWLREDILYTVEQKAKFQTLEVLWMFSCHEIATGWSGTEDFVVFRAPVMNPHFGRSAIPAWRRCGPWGSAFVCVGMA